MWLNLGFFWHLILQVCSSVVVDNTHTHALQITYCLFFTFSGPEHRLPVCYPYGQTAIRMSFVVKRDLSQKLRLILVPTIPCWLPPAGYSLEPVLWRGIKNRKIRPDLLHTLCTLNPNKLILNQTDTLLHC